MPHHYHRLHEVSDALLQGQIGLFPFDTIWGLTGIMEDSIATRLQTVKQRPHAKPLIVMISSPERLFSYVQPLSPVAQRAIDHYWPGPVTLVFNKSDRVSDEITAGLSSVAIRCPSSGPICKLLRLVDGPLLSTSANITTQGTSDLDTLLHSKWIGRLDFTYTVDPCLNGVASTIIDVRGKEEVVLR